MKYQNKFEDFKTPSEIEAKAKGHLEMFRSMMEDMRIKEQVMIEALKQETSVHCAKLFEERIF